MSFVHLPPIPIRPIHHYMAPPIVPIEDDLEPPHLQKWIDYLNQSRNPNAERFGIPIMLAILDALGCKCYNDQLPKVLELVDLILRLGGDPNVTQAHFQVNDHIYSNVSPIHMVYLIWKLNEWDDQAVNELLEQIFDRIFEDSKTDLRVTFSEEYSPTNSNWDSERSLELGFHQSLKNLLEEANLLHYAASIGDTLTSNKILERDPDLIHSQCSTVAGKNLLYGLNHKGYFSRIYSIRSNGTVIQPKEGVIFSTITEKVKGVIAIIGSQSKENYVFCLYRITNVSALHIAAREAHETTCGFLIGRHAFRGALDCEGATPANYLSRAYKGWEAAGGYNFDCEKHTFKDIQNVKLLQVLLKYMPEVPKSLPMPFTVLQKEGFSILYDTRTKSACYVYACVTKEMLAKNVARASHFTVDQQLPKNLRANAADYQGSNYHKGHLQPAANATQTQQSMKDSFKYTNVFPQNPALNLSAWKRLENRVNDLVLAVNTRCVEVFTGSLYLPYNTPNGKKMVVYEAIGKSNIAVPTHVYKVLFIHSNRQVVQEAYVVPNESKASTEELNAFQVTVEYVQIVAGVLFRSMNS